MKRQKYEKTERQKDEKITGAKFILSDDLVFVSIKSKWMMNERPTTKKCTSNAMVGLLYKVKDSIVKIAFVDNEEINE